MFKSVTLEVSLKPFKKTDDGYIRSVCEEIFTQWRPLVKDAETVSVMMWTADGSEILDYSGSLEDSFEWCYFVGQAQLPFEEGGRLYHTWSGDDYGFHSCWIMLVRYCGCSICCIQS